jgi:hypothetical protein
MGNGELLTKITNRSKSILKGIIFECCAHFNFIFTES